MACIVRRRLPCPEGVCGLAGANGGACDVLACDVLAFGCLAFNSKDAHTCSESVHAYPCHCVAVDSSDSFQGQARAQDYHRGEVQVHAGECAGSSSRRC